MTLRTIYPIDQGWCFKRTDDPPTQYLPVAQFPTNVHLDLLYHGLIPDPNVGKNERAVQWVGKQSWDYRVAFSAPESSMGKAVLAFDGLDTYATVRLNGATILKTNDMFLADRVDVTHELLADEPNVLEMTFDSTYLIGKKLVKKYPHHYWGCWNGDPSRLSVRKAQYHYGWDWGPALVTCGPWRPISLEVYDDRISDLSFKTRVSESLKTAEIAVRAEIEGCGKEVLFEISDAETVIAQGAVAVVNGVATATLRAQRPKLWYPHTYGGQPLYLISASLRLNNTCLDICKKRFGIRKARVVQHRLKDASGTSFYVEINNIPIFCGGSNWIPGDNYIPRITAQRYRDWVKTAVESKQVMLRVWGGGIYEEQAFYDAADEMGILVWQDFLFACGNYPANKDFLDLVEQEAIANIKQLRHHPSIVVFAGNNEDYQFCETENLGYNPRDRNPENWLRSTFPARYIYEKVLADVCSTLIPDIYYHFSSPYGGKATSDPTVGDIHQWNIWHGTQQPYQDFPSLIGRFITEFGMEALPCIDTVDSFLTNGREDLDRYALSSTLDFHNKADGHSRRLAVYMDENIRYTFDPLEHYIYYTQLMQAECVTAGYRSAKRDWRGPGSEGCAGMLVWQLNDCWPGTSWAIVDYYMRPKLAYYAVKRELQPITIGVQRAIEDIPGVPNGRRTGRKTEIWAVNLSLEPHDVQITIYSHNLTTNRRAKLTDQPERLLLLSNRSTEITTLEIPVSDQDSEEANQTVIAAYLHDRSGKMLTRAVNWPEPLKWVHTHKPTKIDIRLIGRNGGGDRADSEPIAILLSSEVCIKALQLEVTDSEGRQTVVFEDNGLDLVVGEEVMVGVRGLNWGDEKRVGFRHMGMRVR